MSMFEYIRDIVNFRSRAKGTTTALVSAALANQKAIIFTSSHRMKWLIEKMYPPLKGRVVSVSDVTDFCGRSFEGPLLFDKEAVVELMSQAHREGVEQGKKEVQKEMEFEREIMSIVRKHYHAVPWVKETNPCAEIPLR